MDREAHAPPRPTRQHSHVAFAAILFGQIVIMSLDYAAPYFL